MPAAAEHTAGASATNDDAIGSEGALGASASGDVDRIPRTLATSSSSPALGAWLQRINAAVAPALVRLQYREVTPEDYDLLCLLDEALPQRKTAPPNLVACLPSVLARDCGAMACQVCLDELRPADEVSRLPCGHAFHDECISRWLTECRATCPICASPLGADELRCRAVGQARRPVAGSAP